MTWLTTLAAAPLVLATAMILHTTYCIARNYQAARKIGVPIRIMPISPMNPFWALVDRKIMIFLRKYIGDNTFTRFNWRGWEIRDRYRSFEEMGDVWVLVNPFKNWLYINDPDALMDMFRRGNDFTRPAWMNEMLQVFGPNIAAAEGEAWKTQRRVITRAFNENNNEIVWNEALTLSKDMVEYWVKRGHVENVDEDLRTLSLNILSRAGFGKSAKFVGHKEVGGETDSGSTYKDSLKLILENLVLILALGPKTLENWSRYYLPAGLKKVHEAVGTFQSLMTEMYEEEKSRAGKEVVDNNLMTQFIRASQGGPGSQGSMTEREIYGNLFAVNFAGHDTTSHTFTYTIYFLAAHPEIQEWLAEEIKDVLQGREAHSLDYKTDFPKLKRCLAVMLECLRLYTPVPPSKWTGDKTQTLTVGDKTITMPPETMVMAAYGAVMTDPRWWGTDSLEWKPSRWIRQKDDGSEEIDMHKRGSFIGWSEGTRDCPGKKFSQAEFVATVAMLFSKWRVEPVKMAGESSGDARKRVMKLIEDESGYVLLLQMLHPERAPLVWSRVDG